MKLVVLAWIGASAVSALLMYALGGQTEATDETKKWSGPKPKPNRKVISIRRK